MGLKERIENNAVVWLLGTVVVAFMAGIGAYEFFVRVAGLQLVPKAEVEAHQKVVDDLKSKGVAQNKQIRFLSLYLRYALANLEPFKFEPEFQDPAIRTALDDYILQFIDDSEKAESTVAIGKGHGTQVTVTFPDGSRWAVPPGFKAATRD